MSFRWPSVDPMQLRRSLPCPPRSVPCPPRSVPCPPRRPGYPELWRSGYRVEQSCVEQGRVEQGRARRALRAGLPAGGGRRRGGDPGAARRRTRHRQLSRRPGPAGPAGAVPGGRPARPARILAAGQLRPDRGRRERRGHRHLGARLHDPGRPARRAGGDQRGPRGVRPADDQQRHRAAAVLGKRAGLEPQRHPRARPALAVPHQPCRVHPRGHRQRHLARTPPARRLPPPRLTGPPRDRLPQPGRTFLPDSLSPLRSGTGWVRWCRSARPGWSRRRSRREAGRPSTSGAA
jgi:hypothetical protein